MKNRRWWWVAAPAINASALAQTAPLSPYLRRAVEPGMASVLAD